MTLHSDVLIIGGGPAGLAAAIHAASEGLSVRLLDRGPFPGGQPRESAAIENYPGFCRVTGQSLMGELVQQAHGFGVELDCPVTVGVCHRDRSRVFFYSMDGTGYSGRTTILSPGLSHNTLGIPGIARLLGRGISYGMPPREGEGMVVALVGGGNSAGQAAERLLAHGSTVHMIVHHKPQDTMSAYLLDRLMPRVKFHIADIKAATGEHSLSGLDMAPKKGKPFHLPVDRLAIFAGAIPHTFWLSKLVNLDPHGFIVTGQHDGALPFETNLKGVFAAGDARLGSVKRIAAAVGEGASAVALGVHGRIK